MAQTPVRNTHMEAEDSPSSLADVIDRIEEMRPFLLERMAQTEAEGRVSDEVTRMLIDAGVYRLCQPRRFGGLEHGPYAMFEVGYELGRACGSTAWCAIVSLVNAWVAAYWPLSAQQDIWSENPDALIVAIFPPTGTSERVEGGYRVRGSWGYASNCDNSTWVTIGALLPEEEEGKAREIGWFVVPTSDFVIDHDSWQVVGMQGTGSKTISITEPVFVPEHRMIRFADIMSGAVPGRKIPDNPMARLSFTTFGAAGLAATLLGMSRAALDWYVDAMGKKVRANMRGDNMGTAAQHVHNQVIVGAAAAGLDAAKEMLSGSLRKAEEKIFAGEELTVAERIRIRRDVAFAAQQAAEVVNRVFEGAGSSASRNDSPLQIWWRNVNTGARHATLDTKVVYALYGQEQFGFTPVGVY